MSNNSIYEELGKSIREDEDFQRSFNVLLKDTVLNSLGFKEETDLNSSKIKKLIETASILSLSNDYDKNYALTILNGLLSCGIEETYFLSAIKVLLMRLGNFPTADNFIEGLDIEQGGAVELDFNLRGELIEKYIHNKLDAETVLTDFQAELIDYLKENKSISFSAPTSAGKSFLLIKYISKLFNEN